LKKNSLQDKILLAFFYILTGSFAIICLIPLWVMFVASFTNEHVLLSGGYKLYIPKFDLTAYRMIFASGSVLGSYFITILTTLLGTLLTLLLTSSLAYPLSVKTLKYRNKISIFAYFTMIFSGGLVPTYILYVRYLHINNSIWVLIVPGALNAFNMFLMKNYFTSIPESLSESAKIDGANEIYIYFKIILPLSAPILATIGLFAAMGYWNSWFNVLMYIDNPKLYTLQYLIMRLQRAVDFLNSELGSKSHVTQQPPGYTIRMATAMISIGPIILLYPFLQKYFIKGIMVGSVKG
jgi:putative aldouronate transport system permease protein